MAKRWYAETRWIELRISGRTPSGGMQFERRVVRAGDRMDTRKGNYSHDIKIGCRSLRRCVYRHSNIYGRHR